MLQDDRLPAFPQNLLYSFLTDWGASANPFTLIVTIKDNSYKLKGYLESLGSLEELGKLVLSDIHFPSIHELQNGCQVLKNATIKTIKLQSKYHYIASFTDK